MEKEELQRLVGLYKKGEISQPDINRLKVFLQTKEGEKLLNEIWDKDFQVSIEHAYEKDTPSLYLHPDFIEPELPPVKSYKKLYVAASIIGLLLISYLSYVTFHQEDHHTEALAQSEKILPGRDQAIILLDDGTKINLDEFKGDTVYNGDKFNIHVGADGGIVYRLHNQEDLRHVFNTIVTPKGGEYNLTLPDGSQVWLNADSKLQYPLQFSQDERNVHLEGEAYFDIVKASIDKESIPFIVEAGGQILEVLGTRFNLNSYKEVTTTLVSGKVALKQEGYDYRQILKPNQQSYFDSDQEQYVIKNVDPYYITAWKEGKFAFERSSIYEVMDQVSRWYNVEVTYEGDFSDTYFSGSMSRFADISELLQAIEWTESIKFNIKGRRIVVQKSI